jgi:hypothetical protein
VRFGGDGSADILTSNYLSGPLDEALCCDGRGTAQGRAHAQSNRSDLGRGHRRADPGVQVLRQGFTPTLVERHSCWRALADADGRPDIASAEHQRRDKPLIDAKQRAAGRFGARFAPKTTGGMWLRNAIPNLMDVPIVSRTLGTRLFGDSFQLTA